MDKPTRGIEGLHVDHSIHADGRTGLQTGQQSVATVHPQSPTQPHATEFGFDNEKPHEAEGPIVAHNAAARDEFALVVDPNKSVRVLRPKGLCIMDARVPALLFGPIHKHKKPLTREGFNADLRKVQGHFTRLMEQPSALVSDFLMFFPAAMRVMASSR